MEAQLELILRHPVTQPVGVGILTSMDHDTWADVHANLEKSAVNSKTLDTIRTAITIVCLDGLSPRTPTETIELVLHGGGSTRASANRWFDKMQLIVGENGKAGILFEHSPLDAVVGVNMMEAAATTLLQGPLPTPLPEHDVPAPQLLPWELSPATIAAMSHAAADMDKLVDSVLFRAFHFTAFGKEQMKRHKLSPDAFFQVALQLAYYRLHGHTCATYETGHTRLFALGRTETIRSASSASADFTKAMDSPASSPQQRAALFRVAVGAHSAYTKEAMEGGGVDRHLLGLRLIAREKSLPLPALFHDPLYARSTHWRLSTSTVPMAHNCFPAFGPVIPDGYGLCYNVKADSILAGISSFRADGHTCAHRMAEALQQSLMDINDMLSVPQAKL